VSLKKQDIKANMTFKSLTFLDSSINS